MPSLRTSKTSSGNVLYQNALQGGHLANGRSAQIQVGDFADWIVLDPQQGSLYEINPEFLLDAWIFGSRTHTVSDVCIGGEWVVKSGKHIAEEHLIENYKRAFNIH